jgi:CubicO group peptidase (beta-lactamase class C family)
MTENAEYLAGSANESPIFSTAYTPVYSNEGFAILAILLQKITGTLVETLFNESLSKPLDLKSTYYERPDSISAKDVIPQNPNASGWSTIFGIFSP